MDVNLGWVLPSIVPWAALLCLVNSGYVPEASQGVGPRWPWSKPHSESYSLSTSASPLGGAWLPW